MRSYRPYLIGFFLAVIYAVPVTQTAIELYRGDRPQFLDVFTQRPTSANLRSFERALERASVLNRFVRPWTQYLWYEALRDPGDKAVLGRGGWLFYKPDVRYLVEPAPDDALPAIITFRGQLARRGIRLMVMPVPGKPSIYPDRITGRADFADGSVSWHTSDLIARLRRSGVETIDLLDAFVSWRRDGGAAAPLYLEHDTHWSGDTARRAAELVAARIHALGWFEGGSTGYAEKPVSIRRRGDVIRMMDVPRLESSFPVEQVWCEQVVRADSGERYKDDPHSPVLILGDSFLRMYQTDEPMAAGFIAHLARKLGAPLASIVNDGGASTLVRQQLSRRPELLEGKRVVIWEFVERDVRFGTDGWQDVPLPEEVRGAPSKRSVSESKDRRFSVCISGQCLCASLNDHPLELFSAADQHRGTPILEWNCGIRSVR
jgi:hypothetical protein